MTVSPVQMINGLAERHGAEYRAAACPRQVGRGSQSHSQPGKGRQRIAYLFRHVLARDSWAHPTAHVQGDHSGLLASAWSGRTSENR